jgi:hypothetical protein
METDTYIFQALSVRLGIGLELGLGLVRDRESFRAGAKFRV